MGSMLCFDAVEGSVMGSTLWFDAVEGVSAVRSKLKYTVTW